MVGIPRVYRVGMYLRVVYSPGIALGERDNEARSIRVSLRRERP